jgi:hypothetical protein
LADSGYLGSVQSVHRHDDVIEVVVDESSTDAADDLLSDVEDELERNGAVRHLVVRLIGAPRGMGALVRSLATEARKRNVSVKWRL